MLFNKWNCGGASSAPFTLDPTTAPSVTDNPPGRGAMASGVHAANRATGSRTLPFKSSAFICHPWFLPTIHTSNHGSFYGGDHRSDDESSEKRKRGGRVFIRGINMLIHNLLTLADNRDAERGGSKSEWLLAGQRNIN